MTRALALAIALALASPAAATIDTMFVNHVSGPALCGSFANNPEISFSVFTNNHQRITVPRGATFNVELDGFGADFATGRQDNISGLSSSIVGHGSHNSPSGGTSFGGPAQTGFVTVQIVASTGAALGNGEVQVNYLTGHEIIPLTIVSSCSPPPTPRPAPTLAPGSIPRIPGSVAVTPVLLPDLIPADFQNVRRGIDTNVDCNGAFTGQRKFTAADLKFGVRNISTTAVGPAFAVVLRQTSTGAVLMRVTVPAGFAGNGVATFSFRRPSSDVCVVHAANGTGCFACPATTPPDDRGLEVFVDADNAVTNEASEANNILKIQ